MQTFLHYRWRVPSTLHRLHLRRIIPLLLLALCVTGAKAADVPSTWKPVTFNENIRYSQWVINSRISDFRGNTTPRGFNTYDASGKEISKAAGEQDFDYVPGLVAKAILEAYANYSTFDWSKPWFYSVMNYAKDNSYTTKTAAKGITLDNMNACKMYFPLMAEGVLDNSAASNGTSTITAVIDDMKTYNTNYVIGNATYSGVASSTNETVKSMFGGWFHKPAYKDQMWCDGLYMGAALLAQIVKYKGNAHNITASSDTNDDWDLIAKQFTISWTQLYNSSKGLLYHAFTANPKDEASSKWAGISNTEGAEVYHSAAFWGRAMGWYFLALVDVLEQMPSNNSNRATLIDYLEKLAAGLAKYQDAETGCWYQVIDEKDTHLDGNYLESSCTSLFAAAYLKAVRLGFLTSNGTYDYKTIGVNAFKGAVNQFMKYDTFEPTGTTVQLVHNCASAGLGGTNGRTGSRQYYITGSDVGQTNTYTEGKVMGAFIMAATEYERAPENQKDIRFSYDLAPSYTLAKGKSITAEALGSGAGTATYQWYKTNGTTSTAVTDATTSATFYPTESGTYYCKATSGSTTIQTSPTAVTVSGTVSNGGSGSESLLATLPSTETTTVTCNGTSGTISGSDYLMSGENCYTLNSGGTCVLTIHEGVTVSKIEIIGTSSDNSTQSTIGISDCSGGGNLNTRKSTEGKTTLTFTPTKQASSYTITSSGKGSYIHIKVYGTTTSSSSLSITGPTGATYDVGAPNVTPLSVTVTGAETISYQWYSNTTNSNEGGTKITTNGESNTYTPPVTTAGTTYYYCIATADGQSVTSNAAAVAVLNASNLAYTKAYQDAGNAWTPAVNGTIDVSNLVTSSSKGAYSITTGNDDVATISGTTITALKAGTFTLSQAADDKYKEGSIVITVRIGTIVTSDGTNEYSFTAQTDVSDGMTITCKDITMTFGNDGFWSQAPANGYTGGQVNPQVSAYIPTAGTFYKFTPTKPGSLAVKIRLGHLNGKLRPLYVSENGTLIKAKDKNGTELDPENMPAAESTYVDNVTFNVKKGKDYYVYVTGSKLGFYDFVFTTATVYTVTYNMNGHGTQIDAVTDDNTLPETLPTPTADGYTFVAWYTDKALTQEATPGASISAPTTLYAKWKPITDLFSLTGVTSEVISVESQTAYDVKSADATVTGGSVQLYNGNSKASAAMIYSSQINLNGSGGSYMKITLDNTLKAGDEIIINPAASSFKLSETNSNSNAKSFTGSYVIKAEDAVVGQKEIYLYNNKDGNSVIENISISHPESDSRATFKYNGTAIAFSEKTTGVYTTTLEIGAYEKGKTITITPSVKDGASIKQGETVVSGDINIAVPSEMGETTTYTYTVTSKDETSTTTYEINVKLVKDNVVLVFADSENKTGWTWDKTVNQTKPTFNNPKLKAYLANEDGTASSTQVTINTNIKYLSDVTDVATVDEKNGTITIQDDANGGAKIYAILKDHPDYNDAQTFFNILVKQGYSYSVADDATIKNGPSLNTSVYIKNGEETLVKMTFGGWKWKTYEDDQDNNKVKSKYLVNSSEKIDQWNAAITSDEETIASIDGYKTSVSGATDAVDEAKAASDDLIYGSTRYGWFKPAKERTTDHYLETYPYTLPVRGAYMTFEPTQNGKLTVYILQNGAWNTFDKATTLNNGVSYAKGDIIPGEFRPHSFYICNQRGLNVSQFSPKTFNVATKQKVQGKYYCDSKNPDKQSDPYNIATWTEFKDYMSKKEQAAVEAKWKSGINGAQEIVKLDNGSYLAIQKGIVKYTFFVTANETYYLFSNFSKLGFCGANFVPSETVVPENDEAHKMTLDDKTAYPTIEKPVASATGEDQYKYKFGGTVKGYVEGFTIPLFKSITLNREFKKDQWTTLSLPFNLTQTEVEQIFGKGTQILVFQDAQTEGTKLHIKFFYHEIQNILPGYPYLIKPTLEGYDGTPSTANAPIYTIDTSGDIPILTSFTVYDKAINPNIEQHNFTATTDTRYVAKGTPDYCKKDENGVCKKQYEEGDLFISDTNGKLYISKGASYGYGYRSYIDYTGTDTTASTKTLSLSFSGVEDGEDDGTTTEISVAELADDVIEAFGIKGVYNLNGQKVAETTRNLPAGIYVVNGRKVVVK